MTYEEYLNKINILKNNNNYEVLEQLSKEDNNPNLTELINDKLFDLVKEKTKKSIDRLIINIEELFKDEYNLDLMLINFKKDISFILKILELKQIDKEYKDILFKTIKNDINQTYDILEKESILIDDTGSYLLIIKNNRIKWSD